MEKTQKKQDAPVFTGRESQSVQLKKIVKTTYRVVAIGIALFLVFIATNAYLSFVNKEQLESTMFLNQYRLGSKTLTSEVQSYAVTGNVAYYNNYMNELNVEKNREVAWAGLLKNDITDEEWKMLEEIAAMSQGLVPIETAAMEAVEKGDRQAAADLVFGEEYERTVIQITHKTDACIESIQSRIQKKQNTINIFMLISEVAFALSFIYIVRKVAYVIKFSRTELLEPIVKVSEQVSALAQGRFDVPMDMQIDDSEVGKMAGAIDFMKQNFSNMVHEISDVLGKMGEGNYNVSVTQEYVGEFVRIQESLVKIIADTRKTLSTIRDATQEIDGGSEQLAKAAVDLAEGSTIQAGKVSEVAAMINEMARSMEEKANEAQETVTISSNAGEALLAGNVKMQELKEAIGEISKCSEEIRTIIATIEDIANQTNLLSLNAAIEAARAGEAGKGFAVVADQVKNLAEESAKAAGETTKLIQMTVDAVDKGIMMADQTAQNMDGVMAGAKEATEMMERMALALRQEANNMYRIDENISKVAEIVDNNSATSEETAAVSQEQTAQVATMVQMMEQFEI